MPLAPFNTSFASLMICIIAIYVYLHLICSVITDKNTGNCNIWTFFNLLRGNTLPNFSKGNDTKKASRPGAWTTGYFNHILLQTNDLDISGFIFLNRRFKIY